MDENQKIEQEKILTEGYGWSCYCFARDIPGADIKRLQEKVLQKGDSGDCYCFARDIPGADKERLLKRSKELELKEK